MYLPNWKVHATVARVNDSTSTPEEARAALAEAEDRAAEVRRSDADTRLVLLAIAAMYLSEGIPPAFLVRGGSELPLLVMLAISGTWIAVLVVLVGRIRAYSRPTGRRYALYGWLFGGWNVAVIMVCIFGGWFSPLSPAWHFTAALSVISLPPLLAGFLLPVGGRT
jgi:hypothetical protein